MPSKMYDDRDYAISRLVDTMVVYGGRALMVTGIDSDLRVCGRLVRTGEEVRVDQEDESLVLSSPQIGYINTQEDSYFFVRQPLRRWKQGLDFRAILSPTGGTRARAMLNEEMVAKCIEDDYPSLETALGSFNNRNPFRTENSRVGMAFSRKFAVGKSREGFFLSYKGKKVGVVEQGTPVLDNKHYWLAESLEEALG